MICFKIQFLVILSSDLFDVTLTFLTGSDAPWKTPQNIPDVYLRTLRNEPCNLPYIVEAIAAARSEGVSAKDLAAHIRATSCKVFGLEYLDEDSVHHNNSSSNSNGGSCTVNEGVGRDKGQTKQSISKRDHNLSSVNEVTEEEGQSQFLTDVVEPDKLINDSAKLEKDNSELESFFGCIK